MNTDKLLLLQEGLANLEQAASHLALSHDRTVGVLTPKLLAVVPRVLAYAAQLVQHYARTTQDN